MRKIFGETISTGSHWSSSPRSSTSWPPKIVIYIFIFLFNKFFFLISASLKRLSPSANFILFHLTCSFLFIFIILFEEEELDKEILSNEFNKSLGGKPEAVEFVSDSYDHEALNEEEIKSELKQLKLDSKQPDGNLTTISFYNMF